MKVEIINQQRPCVIVREVPRNSTNRIQMLHDYGLHLLHYGMDYLGYQAKDIPKIVKTQYGKPFFGGQMNMPFFNLSHSSQYVACAIHDAKIGCDIERIRSFPHNLKRELSKLDGIEIMPLSPTEDAMNIHKWTIYEAIGKWHGEGIPVSTDIIHNQDWTYKSWVISENHILSVVY